MSTQEKNGTKKTRGRPATGQGTQIQVRLQPDLLEILDKEANQVGLSRPEAMRRIFASWCESYGHLPQHEGLREHLLMVSLQRDVLAALDQAVATDLGVADRAEGVEAILRDWLVGAGYLKP